MKTYQDFTIKEKMQLFTKFCREKGLRVTPQRLSIYKVLASTTKHPSAEMIYEEIREEYPMISLATVYKTLDTFCELKVVSEVNLVHETARYDANTTPHHHLICIKCRKIEDVFEDFLNHLSLPTEAQRGYQILGHQVQFYGICQKC